jgi:FAD/FMN-containing dehydrogenase
MNKIIEVSDKFAYAVVEPGVTFIDLYNYCVEHKLKVWPSTASLGWGSVMGNVCIPDYVILQAIPFSAPQKAQLLTRSL